MPNLFQAGIATRFTPANARANALKGAAIRAAKASELLRLRTERAMRASLPPAQLTDQRLALLSEQIELTRKCLIAKPKHMCPHCNQGFDMAPKDRAQLLNALDRLLERERVLRCIPAPAPMKQQRPAMRTLLAAPAEPEPVD